MRRFVAALLIACLSWAPAESFAVLKGSASVGPPGNVSITGGTVSGVSGVTYTYSKSNLPIFIAPTGTMANNGAITLGTALNTTYANAYVHLPAGAIAAGVPASPDFYFVQMSSSTLGTVFNNTMSANLDANGVAQIPAAPVAFSTTGPGAYTGVTGAVTVLTISVAASTLGTNGALDFDGTLAFNTSATNKLTTLAFGGSSLYSANLASTATLRLYGQSRNRDSASVQSFTGYGVTSSNTVIVGAGTYGTVNTGSSANLTVALTHATATDNAVLETWRLTVTK